MCQAFILKVTQPTYPGWKKTYYISVDLPEQTLFSRL